MSTTHLNLRIRTIAQEADGIHSFELVEEGGAALPPFTAGAHITLHLPGGLARSYSLINTPGEQHRYVIAVNRDAASRGGSRYLHEQARVGQVLRAEAPRNLFALDETAQRSVLIAGGIGITPIRSMIRRLEVLGRDWRLHYCARRPAAAAFLDELDGDDRVSTYFDGAARARRLDIAATVAALPRDAHVYCCGPLPMLEDFRRHTAALPAERVHFEHFSAVETPAQEGGFNVRLARSGRSVRVPPGHSILQALLDAGEAPAHSCQQGVCGSCETAVLAGRPEHRDQVLSEAERAAGKTMMICCSGSLDAELVLDL
ncbi:PDR/VanB family oxidoreductase [Bordetella flabilis]|uniref:Ferredoxin n=1 Tax=Bordetella flabilis TaxID=463014 RepID=A0A193GEZ9_9BORD|nr:PDR/VanB family oxidoreductase [Bordetella flabilis]ANN78026.1 ferredoxin [Bordetella flabilis]